MHNIYFDTETTGFKPGSICQLAFIEEDENYNIVRCSNEYFTIPKIYEASALEAAKVTGLTPDKLKELSKGQVFSDKALEYFNIFSNNNIVAHNINFDKQFLSMELWRNNLMWKPTKEADTMIIFRPVLKLPKTSKRQTEGQFKNPKLMEVADYYQMDRAKVLAYAKKLFNDIDDNISFHDARFDTTVMYLACKLRGEELTKPGVYTDTFTIKS